jgi:hypothetical protein
MEGLSGTFAFDNNNLNQYPTTHRWVERTQYGVDGNARPVYGQVRSYEMTWNLISVSNAKQIIDFYNQVGNTGSLVACLPQYGAADFQFKNYSGTTLQEPQMQGYFMGFIEELRLIVLNVNRK